MHCFFNVSTFTCLIIFINGGFSELNLPDPHTPLTLMYDQNTFRARVERDWNEPNTIWTKMTACPADVNDFKTLKEQHGNAYCLTPTTERASQLCPNGFGARMVSGSECGEGAKLYTFRYEVCFRNNKDEEQFFPIDVYSVCYDETRSQTLYTKHAISSSTLEEIWNVDTLVEDLQSAPYGDFKHDLRSLAAIYKTISTNETQGDHLIPQMLVPPTNLSVAFARGTNFHYLNVRPQWYHLHAIWKLINETIWNDIAVRNLQAQIYIGTSEVLKIDNELQTYRNGGLLVTIPLIWWILMTTNEGEAVVVVLYNIPPKFKLEYANYVCMRSICQRYDFNGFDSRYVQCCKPKEKILKRLGFAETHSKYKTLKGIDFKERISNAIQNAIEYGTNILSKNR